MKSANSIQRVALLIGRCGMALSLLVPSAAVAEHGARDPCQIAPTTWQPSLAQVRSSIEAAAEAAVHAPQQVLTRTSQDLADLRDAQLFIVYVQLMQSLDAKQRQELFDEQQRWLAKRVETARAAVTSMGGTLEAMEYSRAFGRSTDARLAELRQRLERRQHAVGR